MTFLSTIHLRCNLDVGAFTPICLDCIWGIFLTCKSGLTNWMTSRKNVEENPLTRGKTFAVALVNWKSGPTPVPTGLKSEIWFESSSWNFFWGKKQKGIEARSVNREYRSIQCLQRDQKKVKLRHKLVWSHGWWL